MDRFINRQTKASKNRFQDDIDTFNSKLNETYMKDLYKNLSPGAKVLDIGCLSGISTAYINKIAQFDSGYVVGVDLPEVIELAKRQYPDLVFISCDLNKEFPEGEFDLIFAPFTIEHLYNDYFFLDNCFKHLKLGGMLLAVVPMTRDQKTPDITTHLRYYPDDLFNWMLEVIGFTIVSSEIETEIIYGKESPFVIVEARKWMK